MKSIMTIAVLLLAGGLTVILWNADEKIPHPTQSEDKTGNALAKLEMPDALSSNAQVGKLAYEAECASCHGQNASGQDGIAPPLVHKIYEPSHHGDQSFHSAAENGVQSHHWPFGDMPPVPGATRGDVIMIIAYIRELQRANGIN